MATDFSFIDHNVLGDVADAIRFVEGSTASIAPADYPQRIRALDKYIPDYDVLNFYMPNGGTISLNKTGSPTIVELEYWLDDNGRWIIWQPNSNGNRSLTLTAGQRMYVRNTSETQTGFSTGSNNYYNFAFTSTVEAHGNTNSLLCKNAGVVTVLTTSCYFGLFMGCTFLITSPELPATTSANSCYYSMFYNCNLIQEMRIHLTDISATNCLANWLYNTSAQGDFYCPASLTIPTGASGIPSGWTRHDLT